jgi:hypothetical protein
MTADEDPGLPLEDFLHALTSQLDRAQETMGMKIRAGMPMTFAVKDLTVDLRAHIDMSDSVVRIRPAQAGDGEASVLHLALTTVTRPIIEENTREIVAEPSIKEELGDQLSDDEQRRLEWAGVSTLSQLRDLQRSGGEAALERVANLPVDRLRAALDMAARPQVREVSPLPRLEDGGMRLRITGANLRGTALPAVSIGGRPARVVSASNDELLIQPAGPVAGTLAIVTEPGVEVRYPLAEAAV